MNAIESTEAKRPAHHWGADSGGAAAGVVAALAVIAVGLGVAAALKYTVFKDDASSTPHVTVTAQPSTPDATSTPDASHTPPSTPGVNPTPFSGLWSGIVTGDYTPGYTATVDITQNGLAITGDVNYTYAGDASHDPMDCVGTWTGTVDGNYADIHETMQGTRCTSGVDLRLQLNANGTMLLQILYVNDTHHPVATLTQIGDE